MSVASSIKPLEIFVSEFCFGFINTLLSMFSCLQSSDQGTDYLAEQTTPIPGPMCWVVALSGRTCTMGVGLLVRPYGASAPKESSKDSSREKGLMLMELSDSG